MESEKRPTLEQVRKKEYEMRVAKVVDELFTDKRTSKQIRHDKYFKNYYYKKGLTDVFSYFVGGTWIIFIIWIILGLFKN